MLISRLLLCASVFAGVVFSNIQAATTPASEIKRPTSLAELPKGLQPLPPTAEVLVQNKRISGAIAEYLKDATPVSKKLYVAYFIPQGGKMLPDAQVRLDRVLRHVQAFYRDQMEAIGFGPLTFPLEFDENGLLKLHVVQGAKPASGYQKSSFHPIANEVKASLKDEGIDVSNDYLLIVNVLADADAPYAGLGNARYGICQIVDLPHFDPLRLWDKDKVPEGSRDMRRNVGQDNSVYIGGTAHELGHAFGLPHNQESRAERAARGTSLMGRGNYTLDEDRAGRGKGSFLTDSDGIALATNPLFTGKSKEQRERSRFEINDLKITPNADGTGLTVSGKITATPALAAFVLYCDPEGNNDYDSLTWVQVPSADGSIEIKPAGLKPGKYQLRLVGLHLNGARSVKRFPLELEKSKAVEEKKAEAAL